MGISPNGGVWFLYTLFIFFLITFYVIKTNNIKIILIISAGISIISQLGLPSSQILHDATPRIFDVFRFYIYFLLGLYVKDISQQENNWVKKAIFLNGEFKTLLFLVLFGLYKFVSIKFFCVPIAILGVNLTIIVSQRLKNNEFLIYLGKMSMDIYLLHGPVMVVLRWSFIRIGLTKILIPIAMFTISLGIAVLISKYIIHKIKPIEFLCTGNKN